MWYESLQTHVLGAADNSNEAAVQRPEHTSESIIQPPETLARYRAPVPVRNEVVRNRILDSLDELRPQFLTITAPAGYGKSTLASQWLVRITDAGQQTAWLSLNDSDNSPGLFLSHLVSAISQIIPSLSQEVGTVLEEHPDALEQWVLPVIVDQIDHHPAPFTLVLDDWHFVTGERSVGALKWLMHNLGAIASIVITSRTVVELGLKKFLLSGRLVEVDVHNLRFDRTELNTFIVDSPGAQLVSTDLEQLLEITDGWIAGLQLAMLAMSETTSTSEVMATLSVMQGEVASYLTETVLDSLEPEFLATVLKLGVPERLSADLVEEITGHPGGAALIAEIESRNLFLQAMDDQGEWFRFHHLFSAALRNRLKVTDPQQLDETPVVCARWFDANDLPIDAAKSAHAAGEQELALRIVRHHAMILVEHSRMTTFLAVCELLPTHIIETDFELQIAYAWANCLLQHSAAAQISQDRLAAVETECFPHAEEQRPWTVSVAANIATNLRLRTNRPEAALETQHWARRYHDATVGPFSVVYGLLFSALAHQMLGQEHKSLSYARHALAIVQSKAGPQSHAARLGGAVVAEFEFNFVDDAQIEELVGKYMELGTEAGVVDFLLCGYLTLARHFANQAQPEAAVVVLESALSIADTLDLPRLRSCTLAEIEHLQLSESAASTATASEAAGATIPAAKQAGLDQELTDRELEILKRGSAS